jgi:UDP-N-acetylmuramoylalanine--D-glutamate ligase
MIAPNLPERVLVMGLGVHGGGLGVARWLLRYGVHVTITDLLNANSLAKPIAMLEKSISEKTGGSIRYVLGQHRLEDFSSHDMVVANPAVPPDSPWLAHAHQAGVPIETEMTLFFRVCPGPIIGITGTKGKTTTAMLTGAMVRQQHPDTVIAGNLRVSALAALDAITPTTPVVLELSSFQLAGLGRVSLSPSYSCITNLSPDHLNYHRTMEEYAQAKQHIFLHQKAGDMLVLNHDDQALQQFRSAAPASTIRTFSIHPESGADCTTNEQGEMVFLGEPICHRDEIQLLGTHNLANALAATALARSFGVGFDHIRTALREFSGVEHRLERVRIIQGVHYVNDTTATNPTAAVAALTSFSQPIVLLAGGADKGLPFGQLPDEIVRRTKALILLAGSATSRLEQDVRDILEHCAKGTQQDDDLACQEPLLHMNTIYGPFDDFTRAIQMAQQCAKTGDVVLLSPGCASFGLFRNEFHRGEEFRRIVITILRENEDGKVNA